MPKPLAELFQSIFQRIDAVTPKDGFGARVTDATGGGKSINASATGGGRGPVLKDCVFYDPDLTVGEGEEEQVGAFFYTDLLTTGRREVIEPPEE